MGLAGSGNGGGFPVVELAETGRGISKNRRRIRPKGKWAMGGSSMVGLPVSDASSLLQGVGGVIQDSSEGRLRRGAYRDQDAKMRARMADICSGIEEVRIRRGNRTDNPESSEFLKGGRARGADEQSGAEIGNPIFEFRDQAGQIKRHQIGNIRLSFEPKAIQMQVRAE